MLDKADHRRAKIVRLFRGWVHLHAMDFAGVLAICVSALPLVNSPELGPAPDYPTPLPIVFRSRLILAGLAERASGNYESARNHLLAAQADMERPPVNLDWHSRMGLEYALTELWLTQGDLAQARSQAERFLSVTMATCGADVPGAGLGNECTGRDGGTGLEARRGAHRECPADDRRIRSPTGNLASSWNRSRTPRTSGS